MSVLVRGETLVRRVLIHVSNCTFESNHAAVSGTTAGVELSMSTGRG